MSEHSDRENSGAGASTIGISVVVNTFNGAAMLPAALRCIAAQTFSPLEVLIVDDGSTDNTADLVTAEQKNLRGVRYLKKPHTQLADSRNFALAHVEGSHVAFLDVDDLWSPDYLHDVAHAFLDEPAAELVVAHGLAVREDGRVIRAMFPAGAAPLCGRITDARTLFDFFRYATPSGTAFSKDLYDRIGPFALEFPLLGHDWDWLLRAAAAAAFVIRIDKGLVLYRSHDNNLTRHCDVMFDAWLRLFPKLQAVWNRDPNFADLARRLSRVMYLPLLTYPRDRSGPLIKRAKAVLPDDGRLRLLELGRLLGPAPFKVARALVRTARQMLPATVKLDLDASLDDLFCRCASVTREWIASARSEA